MTARGQGRDVRGQDGKEGFRKGRKGIMKKEKERGEQVACGEGRAIRNRSGHRETCHMLCSIHFQVKMFVFFLSFCILYELDHILSYCIRFIDLENVCLDTKIMCL